jgi:predicted RNA binding protein YcfA (HicA-like mRNA interferase family)
MRLRDVVNKLESLGAVRVRAGKGSHEIWKLGDKTAVVPLHREVSPGVLRDIQKFLGLDKGTLQ